MTTPETREVLVTGAGGFLGSEVVRLFSTCGARVTGIGHGSLRFQSEGAHVSFWSADVTLETLIAHGGAPDVVIHCAAGSSVAASLSDPRMDFMRSVVSCQDVLSYVRLHRPQARLVFTSSAAVYGNGHVGAIDERATLAPISPYGLHKQLCEEMVAFYARTWGVRATIIRLFSIYGEGLRRQLLWDACRKFTAGTPSFSGTGDESRDWIHVSDAAELLREAAARASDEVPVSNCASGYGVAVRDVLNELGAALGAKTGARFDGAARAGDPVHLIGSSKAAGAWNWTPRIPWREGVRRYAHWYLRNVPGA